MDEENQLVVKTDLVTATPEDAEPAPLSVNQLSVIVDALDRIGDALPDLRKPHPKTAKRVRGARTVSRKAVISILTMLETRPDLQHILQIDVDRAREVVDSEDDFRVVSQRLAILQAQVSYTIEARWAELVNDLLAVYDIARRKAERPSEGELAAHVATIRRHLGRRNGATGKRKKTKKKEE